MCTAAEQGHWYQIPVYRTRSQNERLFSEDMVSELPQWIRMRAHLL